MQDKKPFSVGDEVEVTRNLTIRKAVVARGRVVQMYPRFAVIEFPAGYKEAHDYEHITAVKEAKRRATA